MIPRQEQSRLNGNQGGSATKVTHSITQESDKLPRLTGCPAGCPLDHHEHPPRHRRPKYDGLTEKQVTYLRREIAAGRLTERGQIATASEVKICA